MTATILTHEEKVEKLLSAIGYQLSAIATIQLATTNVYSPDQILKHDELMQATIQMIADCK
jgi:hypothetical protein